MSAIKSKTKLWLPLLSVILICVLICVLAVPKSLARYETATEKQTGFKYQAATNKVHLLNGEKDVNGSVIMAEDGSFRSLSTWVANKNDSGQIIENSYVLDFILANGTNKSNACTYDQTAGLIVFASLGLENPENVEIVLNSGNIEYKAVATEVQKGTPIYSKYGPGWTFKFYNASGEELTWHLPGGVLSYKDLRLTVTGAGKEATLLKLIATAGPGSIE